MRIIAVAYDMRINTSIYVFRSSRSIQTQHDVRRRAPEITKLRDKILKRRRTVCTHQTSPWPIRVPAHTHTHTRTPGIVILLTLCHKTWLIFVRVVCETREVVRF